MAKNDQVHEGVKVKRSSATPTNLFSVDSYNLKYMSFKFGNDIFNTFEMPRSSSLMIFWKKTDFVPIPSIYNQRSLDSLSKNVCTFICIKCLYAKLTHTKIARLKVL